MQITCNKSENKSGTNAYLMDNVNADIQTKKLLQRRFMYLFVLCLSFLIACEMYDTMLTLPIAHYVLSPELPVAQVQN